MILTQMLKHLSTEHAILRFRGKTKKIYGMESNQANDHEVMRSFEITAGNLMDHDILNKLETTLLRICAPNQQQQTVVCLQPS